MVTFKNGVSFEADAVFKGTGRYQGAFRDTLEIRVKSSKISFDDLKVIYMDEDALSEITVDGLDGGSLFLTDYTIRAEMKIQANDAGEDVLSMKLAQKTQVEITQAKQSQDINDANDALVELAELIDTIGGGTNG